jgi:hypothetical protein
MLAETHMPGSMFGSTAKKIIEEQFDVLRQGDRYYYEFDRYLSAEDIAEFKNTRLSDVIKRNTEAGMIPAEVFLTQSLDFLTYRTIDGVYNNDENTLWGASSSEVLSGTVTKFGDDISVPAGADRPNARLISNIIFSQDHSVEDPTNISAYAWGWGQFVDHDVTLSPDHATEKMDITIPKYDIYFDPNGTGTQVMPMHRSDYEKTSGTGPDNPRRYFNAITSFIDGSNVYGSDETTAAWLRTFESGKLKSSEGNLLPYNTTDGELVSDIDPDAPEMAMPLPFVKKYFIAGDVRANENPFLTSLHTIFMREHNRTCDDARSTHPEWNDEQLYQHARKLVGAHIQSIVYEEWLPTLGVSVEPYVGYDPQTNPSIMNVFSTAAYRYGHTTINGMLMRMDESKNEMPEGNISLKDAYFNPTAIAEVNGIEPFIMGMSTVVQQKMDCYVIDELRNFLFGPPGAGGLDLAALNINRGRDRGLADFNTIRNEFGYQKLNTFADLTSDLVMRQKLAAIYQDIDNIDPWVGFLAEDHIPGSIFGQTAKSVIEDQFTALRDGDRYYYENDTTISPTLKQRIKRTLLSDIIKRNTGLENIQDSIFWVKSGLKTNTTNIPQKQVVALEMNLYPNPAVDYVSIDVETPKLFGDHATVELIDMNGSVVQKKKINIVDSQTQVKMDLNSSMLPGIYIIRLYNDHYTGIKSFFKNSQ